MSFLHTHSCECTKTELDLFTLPPTQTAIESSQIIVYKPITSLSDDSPIEFTIPGTSDEYIDLAHTMLQVKMKVTQSNDADLKATTLVAPVNNFLHSLFSQVDVFFNQKSVSSPSGAYPYRAYIETLLNYSQEAKNTHLTSSLWYNDTAGKMDEAIAAATNGVTCANAGALKRRKFIELSKEIDMIGHLHCDVFNQEKYLLNGVEMRVRLVRSKSSFCLVDFEAAGCKIKITEASLHVRKAKINPGILIAHSRTLSKTTAKYPLTRVEVKSFTMHSGVGGDTLDNIILGQTPKRIIIGFVSNKAFNGDRESNPFNFQHFNVSYLALFVDGVQASGKALQPRYPDNCVEAYNTLFAGTGIHFSNEGNAISRSDYAYGNALYAFDLTADTSANCNTHWNLVKQGSVRLEVQFSATLTDAVNCVVCAEYDNILEVDQSDK